MPRDFSAPSTPLVQPADEMPMHNMEEDTMSEMSDDVWGDDDGTEPSEVQGLKRQHTTEGYRDGVTVGKEESVQKGFDEGYNIGALFGLRVGWLGGVVDGLVKCAELSEDKDVLLDKVQLVKKKFLEETALEKLFSKDYFDDKAVWAYEVETTNSHSGDEEEAYTFDEVVASHPIIKKWTGTVTSLANEFSLELELPKRTYETKEEIETQ
ncbi:hypothetical protein BJ508DRAFT_92026 [Ascobolus immersus RN42]|uniref:Protein YAE1 n=1 Tax=Ascobolus immersus RN42 TaxID=1160509 RepID=A0A3N4HA09_ASCIM|nr:hypothetical protein BJ508DRAFT_92026 [Ascobolus immersus RN42]